MAERAIALPLLAETWLLTDDAAELLGCSERHVRRLATEQGWRTRLSAKPARNGKAKLEVALSSLPREARDKFSAVRQQDGGAAPAPVGETSLAVRPSAALAPIAAAPIAAAPAADAPLSLFALPGEADPGLIALTNEQRQQATDRWQVIRNLRDFDQLDATKRKAFRAGGRPVRNLTELIAYLATQEFFFVDRGARGGQGETVKKKYSKATIWNWWSDFKARGFSALADSVQRADAGKSKYFKQHPAIAAWVEVKWLNEKISNALHIHDALRAAWPQLAPHSKAEPPSYKTLLAYLNRIPRPLTKLAHDGPKEYFAKCAPFILRTDSPVMDWWVCDNRKHDVLVLNTLFPDHPPFALLRLWSTSNYDMGSRRLLGVALAPQPSSRTIGSAFCSATLAAGGIAPNFYWDNGADFDRFERIVLAPELEDAITRAQVTNALPFRPRSKPVESYFAYWSRRFDPIWRPAWVGRKAGECPEDCRAAQKLHAQFLSELAEVGDPARCTLLEKVFQAFPTDREFITAVMQFREEYNARPHDALDGYSPDQAFDEAWPPHLRKSPPRELLAVAFWQREERTVIAGGCVEIHKARYEPTLDCVHVLADLQGQKIIVKYDPYNLGHALAVSESGRILGELTAQKFLTQSAHGRVSEDEIRAAERRRTSIQKRHQGMLDSRRNLRQSMGWKTERAQLVERASARQFAAGVSETEAITAAAPGARPELQPAPVLSAPEGPAFISDAVREHAGVFAEIELEDDDATAS